MKVFAFAGHRTLAYLWLNNFKMNRTANCPAVYRINHFYSLQNGRSTQYRLSTNVAIPTICASLLFTRLAVSMHVTNIS